MTLKKIRSHHTRVKKSCSKNSLRRRGCSGRLRRQFSLGGCAAAAGWLGGVAWPGRRGGGRCSAAWPRCLGGGLAWMTKVASAAVRGEGGGVGCAPLDTATTRPTATWWLSDPWYTSSTRGGSSGAWSMPARSPGWSAETRHSRSSSKGTAGGATTSWSRSATCCCLAAVLGTTATGHAPGAVLFVRQTLDPMLVGLTVRDRQIG
jgi:hypothetical protein